MKRFTSVEQLHNEQEIKCQTIITLENEICFLFFFIDFSSNCHRLSTATGFEHVLHDQAISFFFSSFFTNEILKVSLLLFILAVFCRSLSLPLSHPHYNWANNGEDSLQSFSILWPDISFHLHTERAHCVLCSSPPCNLIYFLCVSECIFHNNNKYSNVVKDLLIRRQG